MRCVILYICEGGHVAFVAHADEPVVFYDRDMAQDHVDNNIALRQRPYKIIELGDWQHAT